MNGIVAIFLFHLDVVTIPARVNYMLCYICLPLRERLDASSVLLALTCLVRLMDG